MSKTLEDWLNTSSESEDSINTNVKKHNPSISNNNSPTVQRRDESGTKAADTIWQQSQTIDNNTLDNIDRLLYDNNNNNNNNNNRLDTAKVKREQEAAERRQKLADMKNRVKEALGGSMTIPIEQNTERKSNNNATNNNAYISVNTETAHISDFVSNASNDCITAKPPLQLSPPHSPPRGTHRITMANRHSHIRSPHSSLSCKSLDGHMPMMTVPHGHEEIEVMVVDRGSQTTCDSETQTDCPGLMTCCTMCYCGGHEYQHSPMYGYGLGASHCGPTAAPVHTVHTRDAIFSNIIDKGNYIVQRSLLGGLGSTSYMPSHGLPGCWARHCHCTSHIPSYMTGTAASQYTSAGWKEKLSMIDDTVESLIRRYNLPPPSSSTM